MTKLDDARSLIRSRYDTDADILPDNENKKLTIRVHQPTNRSSAVAIKKLRRELNTTRTIFPGTELQLIYEMVS